MDSLNAHTATLPNILHEKRVDNAWIAPIPHPDDIHTDRWSILDRPFFVLNKVGKKNLPRSFSSLASGSRVTMNTHLTLVLFARTTSLLDHHWQHEQAIVQKDSKSKN